VGHAKSKLWEFDGKLATRTKSRPKLVGWERDFYIIQIKDQPPDLVEQFFGRIETSASPVLKCINEFESLPTGVDFGRLIHFMSLMYARGPRWRETIMDMLGDSETQLMKITSSNRRLWDWYIGSLEKDGKPKPDFSYEEMAEVVLSDDFELTVSNRSETHAKIVVHSLSFLPHLFQRMNWGLLITDDPQNFFITSDTAASVVWDDPAMYRFGDAHVGMLETETVFPIHKRIALVGRHEPVDSKSCADQRRVAEINARTARFAWRYLFAPRNDFTFLGSNDELLRSEDWFSFQRVNRQSVI
jgi:hypothetical protein